MEGDFFDVYTCSECVDMVCQNREYRYVLMPSAWAWDNKFPSGITDSDEGGDEYIDVTFECGGDRECDEECEVINTGQVTYVNCVAHSPATYDFTWYYLSGNCFYDPEE